jgi:flagellar hook-length control protein FliK
MDAAAAPVVTESSPQRLAVGVRDAGLGWVEIRTHAAGGQVSAVLTAASSEAQAALTAHLPEVREYLAGQQVRVDQLSSERLAPGDGEGSSRGQGGSAGNAQSGSAPGRNSDTREQGSLAAMFGSDGNEESLSYINVRV